MLIFIITCDISLHHAIAWKSLSDPFSAEMK